MVHLKWKDVLKSVLMRHGELFVIISGVQMMETLLANSLASQGLVCDHGSLDIHIQVLNSFMCVLDAQTFPDARYGAGSGRIYIGSLQCTGSEARLTDCPRGTIDGCTHQDDAGLACNISMMLIITYKSC